MYSVFLCRIRIKTGRFTQNVEYWWKQTFPLILHYQNRRMVESHTKRQGSMCSSKKERWFTSACHRLTSVTASRYKLYVIGIFNTGPFFLFFFFVKSNDSEWKTFNLRENCVTCNHLSDVNNFVCKVWYDNTKIRCVWSKLQMYLCNLF